MSEAFTPAWANTDAPAAAPAAAMQQPPSYGTTPPTAEPANAKKVQYALSMLNLGLAVLMSASGFMAVAKATGFSADIFVAIYMILFGVLLFSYELMFFKSVDSVVLPLRKNFGFLFGIKGKAIFIIFIAFLNFGLNTAAEPAKSLGLATGICFLVNGLLHFTVMLKYPEYVASGVVNVQSYNVAR
ncbi:hypothetical protein TeGR_g3416 [Tetraparma gracilis]|uniref:Uncharacterized protein n=1 Tax=Tetraparma gracilis TaxID=2962635 RepID=A0ABQ6N0G4_9STRA|nr:hypothetical protein TeGR_g3416 [Tetraparma gracilis]